MESIHAVAVMCLLGDRKAYGGGTFQVELDEKLGPFCRYSEAGPDHLEGGFADAVEGAAYDPGGDEAGCVSFFCMFQGVDKEE